MTAFNQYSKLGVLERLVLQQTLYIYLNVLLKTQSHRVISVY